MNLPDWTPQTEPEDYRIPALGWLRVLLGGAALLGVLCMGLGLLLLIRLFERPIWGLHRPLSPFVTQGVCRIALLLLGLKHQIIGRQMGHKGALVSNHSSWLDVFALNAGGRLYFVAKSEVSGWAGIGWLSRATGTLFIRRARADAQRQKQVFENRLIAGHKLLFFPEGTSTDGLRVLPFKSTLYAAFFTPNLRPDLWIQPVCVSYRSPAGTSARFYGWWGDTAFAPHLLRVLSARRGGLVRVQYHEPLRVCEFANRKTLAQACEETVRTGVEEMHSAQLLS